MKTGGLADVSQSLPQALKSLGHDVRLVMPAYQSVKQQLKKLNVVAKTTILGDEVELLKTTLPGTQLPIFLVDCPKYFDRKGNPYISPDDKPWPDNAKRFALFSRIIGKISCDQLDLGWQPDILHCNDWQTALAPALLHFEENRPGILFTIHNLAYQGVFPYSEYLDLKLPAELWSIESMEFYNKLSFIKGGIIYSDQVNTVSPTYAKEIQTEQFGAGLNTLLSSNAEKLTGIVNGINLEEWDPNSDPNIISTYNIIELKQKTDNKISLQEELGLEINAGIPMLSTVSRLVKQKGIDLIIDALSTLKEREVQFVVLGSGDEALENALINTATLDPDKFYVKVGYDEALAHRITAAADMFIMPSRFEPCGLNQMYSQRYGTIPIVRKTGGLADTVIDHENANKNESENTGIIFETATTEDLLSAINRGIDLYKDKNVWERMQLNAMRKNFSWENSALQYLDLYKRTIDNKRVIL